ncbi:class I SAM-dependent methyltransferase [Zavarzinella formosa]|uniref:class I SAM-dependent methyltransferase n=1 Tax=Zavarzinella formosa TaxID=360055 RepID=UPI0002E856A0|nr:methyltransferase domain-containing protein [Zavarzinella formosa]
MKFVNPKVVADIAAGRLLKLDLGCGPRPKEGYYGVDHADMPTVDIAANLEEPLTELPANSVEAIVTRHTMEHIVNFLPLLKEIHRVVIPGGTVDVEVPHFSNPYYYSDPTHVRFFGLYTFHYFSDPVSQPRRPVPNFYMAERFQVRSIKFSLMPTLIMNKPIRRLSTKILNCSFRLQDYYERALCRHFPVSSIKYALTVQK